MRKLACSLGLMGLVFSGYAYADFTLNFKMCSPPKDFSTSTPTFGGAYKAGPINLTKELWNFIPVNSTVSSIV